MLDYAYMDSISWVSIEMLPSVWTQSLCLPLSRLCAGCWEHLTGTTQPSRPTTQSQHQTQEVVRPDPPSLVCHSLLPRANMADGSDKSTFSALI